MTTICCEIRDFQGFDRSLERVDISGLKNLFPNVEAQHLKPDTSHYIFQLHAFVSTSSAYTGDSGCKHDKLNKDGFPCSLYNLQANIRSA